MSSLESTFKPTGKKVDYENYWEAPTYLWVQKEVTEREMESVMVGDVLSLKRREDMEKADDARRIAL